MNISTRTRMTITEYVVDLLAQVDGGTLTSLSREAVMLGRAVVAPLVWAEIRRRGLAPAQRDYPARYWKWQESESRTLRYPPPGPGVGDQEERDATRAFEHLVDTCLYDAILAKLSYLATCVPEPIEGLAVTLIRNMLSADAQGIAPRIALNVKRGVRDAVKSGLVLVRGGPGRRSVVVHILPPLVAACTATPSELEQALSQLPPLLLPLPSKPSQDGHRTKLCHDEIPSRWGEHLPSFVCRNSERAQRAVCAAIEHIGHVERIAAFLRSDLVHAVTGMVKAHLHNTRLAETPVAIDFGGEFEDEPSGLIQTFEARPEEQVYRVQQKLLFSPQAQRYIRGEARDRYPQERSWRAAAELFDAIRECVVLRLNPGGATGRVPLGELAARMAEPRGTTWDRLRRLVELLRQELGLELELFISTGASDRDDLESFDDQRGPRVAS
jgi:hypothetical protein